MRKLLIRTEVYLKTDEFQPKNATFDDEEGFRIIKSYPVATTVEYEKGISFWGRLAHGLKMHAEGILDPRSWRGLIWWRKDNEVMPEVWSERLEDNEDGSEAGP